MQKVQLEEFPNKSGWHVVHDGETQLFKLVSEAGRVMQGAYTSRTFAEDALRVYLEKNARANARITEKTKARQAEKEA